MKMNLSPHVLASGLCLLLVGGCATGKATSPVSQTTPPAADAAHTMGAMSSMGAMDATASMGAAGGMSHHDHGGGAQIVIPAGARYTEADVSFMQGMIAHHAQAIYMSRMAPTRDADPRLARLAHKIDLSQAGEIAIMQDWLRANGQAVPDTSSWRTMMMQGMLTTEQLAQLEAARGPAFDQLFLRGMIYHHEGALTMVEDLYASPRAAQDVDISVLANDIETTQRAEIGLMRRMLVDM